MQLILVRHGETLWNKEGRVQGTSDVELSETGAAQAQKLAFSLKERPLAAIYASPLKRARQTAEAVNQYHGKDIQLRPDLMEMNQGDFEGQPFRELMNNHKDFLKEWFADPASVTMPNGESLLDVQQRAWQVVEDIIAQSEDALIVSHNFTIAAILCKMRGISLSEFRSTCVDTASQTIVTCENGTITVDRLNDRSHLEGS